MATNYNPRIITDGLVLCLDAANPKSYPGSGTTWTDLSGQGNTGTLVNGVGYSGSNLGSLSFDGVNDRVDISYTPNLAFTSGILSLNAWIYVNSLEDPFPIIAKRDSGTSSNRPYIIQVLTDGALNINLQNASVLLSTSASSISTNQWYYVSGTADETTAKLYINDVENVSVIDNTTISDTGSLVTRVGYRTINTGFVYGNGNIAQVSIYNRALTPQEVQQNFNATKSRYL